MTQQEMIDRDIRMLVGDLSVQLIFARTRVTELEAQLAAALKAAESGPPSRPNGAVHVEPAQA